MFTYERLIREVQQIPEYPGIDPQEVADMLNELMQIGLTPEGGMHRFPYTTTEKQAKEVFIRWMEEAGLKVSEDAIGNLYGRLDGQDPTLPVVMTGSHLDSVPNGGAFDGPLGCISSLLAVKAIQARGIQPKHGIEVVVFVDEEGARFRNGIFGSRVLMGEVTYEDLLRFQDDAGIALVDAMREIGFTPENVQKDIRKAEEIHAFLELHIEQGVKLEATGTHIGVVEGIAGPAWLTAIYKGNTDHAGNTPMDARKDTVPAAAELILEVEKLPRQINDTAVATVGKLHVFPNGSNVIAGETQVTVDVRDIYEDTRADLLNRIHAAAERIAQERGLEVTIEQDVQIPPVLVPEEIQQVIRDAAGACGLSTMPLVSGAGHDAMIMGKYVPSGMVFVPSHNGKSHSPDEWTELADCVNGVAVMTEALITLSK